MKSGWLLLPVALYATRSQAHGKTTYFPLDNATDMLYKIFVVQNKGCGFLMRNITGAVARGDDFFDRIKEMALFWRDLETDNLLLLAPRRVGKTSLLRKMEDDAEHHGRTAVYVDVSDCADELHFVQRLYATILENQTGDLLWERIENSWLSQALKRVQKV